jgi:hypothetical protein
MSRGWYNRGDGNSWQISFDKYEGDVPLLLEVDVSNLDGGVNPKNITGTAIEYIKGSANQFMNPIPSDYLFTAEQKPQIHVTVKDITASCRTDCSFTHSSDFTPTVTAVSNHVSGDQIVVNVNGTLFSTDQTEVTVYVGQVTG